MVLKKISLSVSQFRMGFQSFNILSLAITAPDAFSQARRQNTDDFPFSLQACPAWWRLQRYAMASSQNLVDDAGSRDLTATPHPLSADLPAVAMCPTDFPCVGPQVTAMAG